MADINDRLNRGTGTTSNETGTPNTTISTGHTGVTGSDWSGEDSYWRSSYASRPYAKADRSYEHFQGAYRYGYDSANRFRDRVWNAVESDLRSGWDTYEYRGSHRSTWDEVKDAVRDAWDRVRGR
jgi:hypothetical protein